MCCYPSLHLHAAGVPCCAVRGFLGRWLLSWEDHGDANAKLLAAASCSLVRVRKWQIPAPPCSVGGWGVGEAHVCEGACVFVCVWGGVEGGRGCHTLGRGQEGRGTGGRSVQWEEVRCSLPVPGPKQKRLQYQLKRSREALSNGIAPLSQGPGSACSGGPSCHCPGASRITNEEYKQPLLPSALPAADSCA